MGRTEAWQDRRITVSTGRGFDAAVAAHVEDRLAALDSRHGPHIRRVHGAVRHLAVPGYGEITRIEVAVCSSSGDVHAVADADSVYAAVDKVLRAAYRRLVVRAAAERHRRGEGAAGVPRPGTAPQESADDAYRGPWVT
ncbi:ribosome-associated translation inhibitor RaiA [Nocardiopsis mwathae]|uniref:Ribosome-associated translation inhibitor RaiA n=1 Tax=Nocardiopsis mwathae TaxID=1472723 RepID=A0A7W9YG72_9ACTN|nr:HPF/RaiA family ribosome-associated protein [Nocardiopsis mwathae]MBB6171565.1 ribosome-associated translation inhibitor RaiA [Nocardiopsis mwathae]